MNESCASYCVIYLGSDEVNSGRFGFMGHRFMVSDGRRYSTVVDYDWQQFVAYIGGSNTNYHVN